MATTNFYKYLESAFRYRVRHAEDKSITPSTRYSDLGYSLTYKKIFEYARKLLPAFYRNKEEFPDTEEGNLQLAKKVLEKLDKHQDLELENKIKGTGVSIQEEQAIAKAQEESQQAAGISQATEASGGGAPFGRAPSVPTISSAPRTIHPVPQTQSPIKSTTETEVPKAFQEAFKDEPLYKTDPTVKPPEQTPSKTSFQKFNTPKFTMPNAAKDFGSNAQIFASKNLSRIGGGLWNITKGVGRGLAGPGITSTASVLGKIGNGGLNTLEIISRPGGIGGGGLGKSLSKSSNKLALDLIGIMLFLVLLGGLFGAISQTTPGGTTTSTVTNISNCKFTRGQETPSAAKFQSNQLLSYIQEAASKSTIPPVVLASFIRVESPASSYMSDEQIAAYACIYSGPGKNVSETGALGIMQIQPPGTKSLKGDEASCTECIDAGAKLVGKTVSTMTTQDYCDPRTSIIVGAGWILKKMSNIGFGDGTKWDPAWTNNPAAIKALVNTYYGDVLYPDVNTGPYNYATDVQASIQNCQASSGTIPPPADGNYKKWLEDYGIKIHDGFVPDVYQWAYEAIAFADSNNSQFKTRLGAAPIEVKPTCNISITRGRTINLRNREAYCIGVSDSDPEGPTSEINLFKHTLIHELGHVIYNMDRAAYNPKIIAARVSDDGFLTLYGERASSNELIACGTGEDNGNRADEDFAESISYFINRGITTQNYGCGIRPEQLGINPFDQQENGKQKYSAHYQFMTELLK